MSSTLANNLADLARDVNLQVPRVRIGDSAPLFRNWTIEGGIYIDDKAFCEEVLEPCKSFDAITYTVHPEMMTRCKKLIAAVVHAGPTPKRIQIRKITNVHTKLYIVRGRCRVDAPDVWVGSMNLVRPGGLHNVMVKLDGKRAYSMELYFDRLWNLAPR